MKGILVGFLAGVIATSGTAYAASSAYFRLRSGDQTLFQGVLCTTNGQAHAVACALNSRYGYAAAVSRTQIVVLNAAGRSVFYKRQP